MRLRICERAAIELEPGDEVEISNASTFAALIAEGKAMAIQPPRVGRPLFFDDRETMTEGPQECRTA